jgi:CBS domain-containing protein
MKVNEAKLGSWSKRSLVTVDFPTPIEQAVEKMKEANIHHLIVLKEDRYIGMVSAADIMSVYGGANWYGNSRSITVGEVTRFGAPIVTENADIKTALSAMLKNGLTAVPIERDGQVCDIITETDLLRLMDSLLEKHHALAQVLNKGESLLANPFSQKLMKALADAGI